MLSAGMSHTHERMGQKGGKNGGLNGGRDGGRGEGAEGERR